MSIEQKEVVTASATGEEIGAIVAKIEGVISEERIDHSFIATLAIACLIMNPDLNIEQLQKVLDNVSRYLIVAVDQATLVEQPVVVTN